MSELRVTGGGPLKATLRVPGDKSVSHRALMIGALAEGTSVVQGLSPGDDVARTRAAVIALGATVVDELGTAGAVRITGGRGCLHEPDDVLDCGNSGTTIRLLAGLCSWVTGLTILTGDASLRTRPMGRVIEPLKVMGAMIEARGRPARAPLAILGTTVRGRDLVIDIPSAQVKSAVLLAALGADGSTSVVLPAITRAHTEELLVRAGADLTVTLAGRGARLVPGPLRPFELAVPGDPSQAAFWLVAASIVEGSEIEVADVYQGPARSGFLHVLARMGAKVEPAGDGGMRAAHPGGRPLRATTVAATEVPGLVDEVPVLAVAAALAEGTTVFCGVGELRVKESDRVATMAEGLRAMGVTVATTGDELAVTGTGGRPLRAAHVESHGDHRVAMALAVAALAAEGETVIDGWEAVATSYPGFEDDLRSCRS